MNKIIREIEIYKVIGGHLSENAEYVMDLFENLFDDIYIYVTTIDENYIFFIKNTNSNAKVLMKYGTQSGHLTCGYLDIWTRLEGIILRFNHIQTSNLIKYVVGEYLKYKVETSDYFISLRKTSVETHLNNI